jgi:putative ABC transport system permease protein
VFGVDPDDPVFLLPDVRRQMAALKQPDTALIDSRSRRFYGALETGLPAELTRRTVRIVGTFPLGADFRNDGSVIVSDRTFVNALGNPANPLPRRSRVELGLVSVRRGADIEVVKRALAEVLPADVEILTKQQFIDRTRAYWNRAKPVGMVFGLGMVVGFLIGVAICYQILYLDITDHLPQFATLKAIGYHNRMLVDVVLRKALYLGALGFVAGLIASLALYALLQTYSGIRMELTIARTLLVLVATLAMCQLAAVVAVRKVLAADPAEMF